MYELVFASGPRANEAVPVVKTLIAGRSPGCSLEVPDLNASREHARFVFDGSSLSVVDNKSSNGTYVNDLRITAVALKAGDVVRMGETRIRVQTRRGDSNAGDSSIFTFRDGHEAEPDLSHSIVVSAGAQPVTVVGNEILALRLQAIMNVSKALVNIARLDDVLGGILDALFEVFPQADRGFLMLGSTAERLVPKAVRRRRVNGPNDGLDGLVISTSICRKALAARSAYLFNDQDQTGTDSFAQGLSIINLRIRSAMTVPLMVGDEILGLLQIDTENAQSKFVAADLDLAVAVSQQAAIAVHNALLLQKVEKDAATRRDLARFLPSNLAEQVMSGKIDIALGGRTYRGTVLFSDVVGFTRISETLSPEHVVALMNGYFNRMIPCIDTTEGAFDKFIGDALMAYWGIPFDRGDSAAQAAQTAIAMQVAMLGFNAVQMAAGAAPLGIGIGLNTGEVVAGNIGALNQMQYTLLGDCVNVAARIEHAASRGQVLVSGATWSEFKDQAYGVQMPPLMVRNKSEALTVFSLRGLMLPGGEVALHLPLRSGDAPVTLIRRLADRSMVALHPPTLDLTTQPLCSQALEWPDHDVGLPTAIVALPSAPGDGPLKRSRFMLGDGDLCGLIAPTPLTCAREWHEMTR